MVDADEAVVLVDEQDRPVGIAAKLDAHRTAARHRAFSVFITDSGGNVLLQSRALSKYHSPGLWSNACCGHPRVGEAPIDAARRRLFEEMGIDVPLTPAGRISYEAELPGGWHENEIVHLFIGSTDTDPAPSAQEVGEWRRISRPNVLKMAEINADAFTAWFRIYLDKVPDVALGG